MSQDKAVIEREMNEMARTGARWFRAASNGPAAGAALASTASRSTNGWPTGEGPGIRIIANVAYTPGWAQPGSRDAMCPADPGNYARFLKKLVQNFSPPA